MTKDAKGLNLRGAKIVVFVLRGQNCKFLKVRGESAL